MLALLRNGISYAGKSAWTAAHLRWLATLKMMASARIARLEQAMRNALPDRGLRPLVQALHALRGVQLVAILGALRGPEPASRPAAEGCCNP